MQKNYFTSNDVVLKKDELIVPVIISNNDAYKFQKQIDEFTLDKKILSIIVNCTSVVTGVQNISGQPVAQMQNILMAVIQWHATKEQYNSYLFMLKTSLKAN